MKEHRMPGERYVMGLFSDENQAAAVAADLPNTPWKLQRVHSPIPSHKLALALKVKKSKVGWFTLAGGIIGFFTGFLLAIFTATRWELIVSGKPVVSLIPFFIVGFEFTILFAVFGNVIGLITQTNLPDFGDFTHYDPRCSGTHFGILATCAADGQAELEAYFRQRGGEARVFEA
jgi:molybdopterin-containing oxidoreductase family membrane subunit